jgi:choline-sulfatase
MPRPHLILIFADQLHHQARSSRDPQFATPALERCAAAGLDCRQAWCTTPLCSPSRSTLFTGWWPHATAVVRNGIHLRQPTIAPRLQEAGYRTAYCGKWHLGDQPQATAGWDVAVGVCDEYRKPNRPLSDAETLAAACLAIGSHDPGQPLFLTASFDEPHGIYAYTPGIYPDDFCPRPGADPQVRLPTTADGRGIPALQASSDQQGQTRVDTAEAQRAYLAMYRERVSAFDRCLEAVLAALAQRDLLDDSVVVVTSDHGDMATRHALGFKGHFAYDDVQQVPLIVRCGARLGLSGRGHHDGIVALADVPATFLDLAGCQPMGHGLSLAPLLRGQRHERQATVVQYVERDESRWSRCFIDEHWKYLWRSDGSEALVDRRNDPDETAAVADPLARAACRRQLAAWARAHDDHRLLERIAQEPAAWG